LENGVIVGAGAKVLGNITIGAIANLRLLHLSQIFTVLPRISIISFSGI
jgi:hypothetical protein